MPNKPDTNHGRPSGPAEDTGVPHTAPGLWMRMRWALLTIAALLGFSAGFIFGPVGSYETPPPRPDVVGAPGTTDVPGAPEQLVRPDPGLSPEQVVEIQLAALAACRDDRSAIHQVYALASPDNQAVTGPLPRFERMIHAPPYQSMTRSNSARVGRAARQGDIATVLVTMSDDQQRLSVFRFYLSLQSDEYAGCWMTDAVICVLSDWRPLRPESAPPRPQAKPARGV